MLVSRNILRSFKPNGAIDHGHQYCHYFNEFLKVLNHTSYKLQENVETPVQGVIQ